MSLLYLVFLMFVMLVASMRWRKLNRVIDDWYERKHAVWPTKPNLQSLLEQYAVPAGFFRAQAMISFWTVMVVCAIFNLWRFFFKVDMFLVIVATLLVQIWTFRFFDCYRYVNEYARREAERLARETSSSSRK